MQKSILENHINNKLSFNDIAKIENCSLSTVIYWAKKYGLKSYFSLHKEKYTKETLKEALPYVSSLRELAVFLGASPAGGTISHLRNKIDKFELDTTHFKSFDHTPMSKNRRAPVDILVKRSKIQGRERPALLKRAMIESGQPYKCSTPKCPITDSWLGKPVTLHIHHLDGDWSNNVLNNLQFLCPLCHSQTPSYSRKKSTRISYFCECGVQISRSSKRCHICDQKFGRPQKAKIIWPSDQDLTKMVWEKPRTLLAQELGVSDKAIAKHCERRGIAQPPRGYWMKIKFKTTQTGVQPLHHSP